MRGPDETSTEGGSETESQPLSKELRRDPCESPPCKRLKQAQLSFTTPASPKPSSSNGAVPNENLPATPVKGPPQSTDVQGNAEMQSGIINNVSPSNKTVLTTAVSRPPQSTPDVQGTVVKLQGGIVNNSPFSIETIPSTPVSQSPQSTPDVHSSVAGGLVTGAPSPEDRQKGSSSKHNLQSPRQLCQNVAVNLHEQSLGVNQMDSSSSCSPAAAQHRSPEQKSVRKPSSAKKSAEEQTRKREEKMKQRLEKQLQKQEKEKKQLEARAIREKERLEAKQKKELEKLEKKAEREKKEKERLDRKQKEEQERLEKNRKKEDERRRKEEERRKKEEEKNAKLEVKRKRDQEKKQQEEEQLRKKQKIQQNFASFFSKEIAPIPKVKPCNSFSRFQPFEIKQHMSLAPEHRKELSEEMKNILDSALLTQDTTVLYLEELRERRSKQGSSKSDVSMEPCEVVISDENSNSSVKIIEDKKECVAVKAKLFQFHENNRPPYFGSWRKKSQVISPRNPFKQDDQMLDYEVDSDDEWEEEEPGESLSNSEGEDEDDAGDEDDQDGFFVPHGYLSDGEGIDDEDAENQNSDPSAKKEQQLTKAKQWEAELKRKCKRLKPVCIGCLWLEDAELNATLKQFEACVLTNSVASSEKGLEPGLECSPVHHAKIMPVPEGAMPDLIKLLQGNSMGLMKLTNQFRRFWTAKCLNKGDITDADVEDTCQISKRQLERKIQAIATKERRGDKLRWYVHRHVLSSYGLEDLDGESLQDKENEGRITPPNTAGQGGPNILKFVKAVSPGNSPAMKSAVSPAAKSSTVTAQDIPIPQMKAVPPSHSPIIKSSVSSAAKSSTVAVQATHIPQKETILKGASPSQSPAMKLAVPSAAKASTVIAQDLKILQKDNVGSSGTKDMAEVLSSAAPSNNAGRIALSCAGGDQIPAGYAQKVPPGKCMEDSAEAMEVDTPNHTESTSEPPAVSILPQTVVPNESPMDHPAISNPAGVPQATHLLGTQHSGLSAVIHID